MRILLFIVGIIFGLGILGGIYFYSTSDPESLISPFGQEQDEEEEKILAKYSFSALQKRVFTPSEITLGRDILQDDSVVTQMFYFKSDGKVVSGVMNVPKEPGTYPVLIMFRGFVERASYTPGIGTNRGAEYFSHNGFITISPDFLGYGESDLDSFDSLESRFETYTTALNLFASLPKLNEGLAASYSAVFADPEKVGMWAHSNGGQIALSTLAISGKKYPTSLWAPVSKPFPYSILYFTDEFEDEGKALRRVVAEFEEDYDVFEYSPPKYYSWIQAPLQIHQGTLDDAVPVEWSVELENYLSELEKDVELFIYPGADHNLAGPSWSEAMVRSRQFILDNFPEE